MTNPTAETILKAMVYHGLTVFSPTLNGVRDGTQWYARNSDGTMQGFGPTPAKAVEAAVDAA